MTVSFSLSSFRLELAKHARLLCPTNPIMAATTLLLKLAIVAEEVEEFYHYDPLAFLVFRTGKRYSVSLYAHTLFLLSQPSHVTFRTSVLFYNRNGQLKTKCVLASVRNKTEAIDLTKDRLFEMAVDIENKKKIIK